MAISSIAKDSVGVVVAAGGGNGRTEALIGKTKTGTSTDPRTPVPGAVMEMAVALLRRRSRIASGILCVNSGKSRSRNRRLNP
jgi:hypothetical protein